jgi:hypothetical protein
VRFDPDNLARDVHLYGLDGRYLASAEKINDTGFDNAAAAKLSAKRWANYRKMTRAATKAEDLLSAEEVARQQADFVPPELPEPSVIHLVRHRGQTAAAVKAEPTPRAVENQEREARFYAALRSVESND